MVVAAFENLIDFTALPINSVVKYRPSAYFIFIQKTLQEIFHIIKFHIRGKILDFIYNKNIRHRTFYRVRISMDCTIFKLQQIFPVSKM